MGWFKKKASAPPVMVRKRVPTQEYTMHLLALDPRTGEGPYAVHAKGSSRYILPAITTNGHISFLLGGTDEEFNIIYVSIQNKVSEQPQNTVSYICTAVSASPPGLPYENVLICEVAGAPTQVPELEQIYQLLTNLRVIGDDCWNQTERYLQSEPIKSWITDYIETLKIQLNWNQYVQSALDSYIQKKRY